jgi:glycerol kinase
MKKKYVLVLDQGTTSSRTIIFDYYGNIVSQVNKEFNQIYPKPAWVEHDAEEILESQVFTMREVVKKGNINANEIACIGITNQRETCLLWDKKTFKPVYNAIVWQCRRSKNICENLIKEEFDKVIKEKTGLVTDAYFSATKVKWLFENINNLRERAKNNEILFGTIDTWLLYNLTKGKSHYTDVSNASRTMLFNIHTLEWDNEILSKLDIPQSILPEVKPSSFHYGYLDKEFLGVEIPISGIVGDQQSALFGQTCFDEGQVKNTYGTGCFMLMNTGNKIVNSNFSLLTSVGWKINNNVSYVLEGSVFIGGAVVQWLRDELKLIENASDSEAIANSLQSNEGVYIVPAFVGLGTPYWNMDARGIITGITRGTNRNHIVRAALESIAYQTKDLLDCMNKDANLEIKSLAVDGGASANNFLMQFQSDILNINVNRPKVIETTALGSAYLSGLCVGFWNSLEEIKKNHQLERVFIPSKNRSMFQEYYNGWINAVNKALK